MLVFITKKLFDKGAKSYVYKEYEMAAEFYKKQIVIVLMEQIEKKGIPHGLVEWWLDIMRNQCIQKWEYDDETAFYREIKKAVNPAADQEYRLRGPENQVYPLKHGLNSLGRLARKVTVVLPPDYSGISSIHCCIIVKNNQVFVQNLGATNGTYLNGERLKPHQETPAHEGDKIGLANYEFTIEVV
jgi:hypothetical protein